MKGGDGEMVYWEHLGGSNRGVRECFPEKTEISKMSRGRGAGWGRRPTVDRQCVRKELDRVKELRGTWWQAGARAWQQPGDRVQGETRESDVLGGENSSLSSEHWEATEATYVEQGKTRLTFWKDPSSCGPDFILDKIPSTRHTGDSQSLSTPLMGKST